jgi:hypothetical protein
LSHSTIFTMGCTLVKTCVEVTWECHQALAIVYDIWMHVRISKWVSGWPTKDHERSPIIRTNEGLWFCSLLKQRVVSLLMEEVCLFSFRCVKSWRKTQRTLKEPKLNTTCSVHLFISAGWRKR